MPLAPFDDRQSMLHSRPVNTAALEVVVCLLLREQYDERGGVLGGSRLRLEANRIECEQQFFPNGSACLPLLQMCSKYPHGTPPSCSVSYKSYGRPGKQLGQYQAKPNR